MAGSTINTSPLKDNDICDDTIIIFECAHPGGGLGHYLEYLCEWLRNKLGGLSGCKTSLEL